MGSCGDVGMTGVEPATSRPQTEHSTKLSYIPMGRCDPTAHRRNAAKRPKIGLGKPIAPFLLAGYLVRPHVIRW